MSTKLTWVTLANGDLLCEQYPIRVRKPLGRGEGWVVQVPASYESADNTDLWTDVYDADDMDGITRAWRKAEVASLVAGDLDRILADAATDTTLAGLWTGSWSEADRQRVIDGEAEKTALFEASMGATNARIVTNRPTPRADLLAMLDAARPYIAHAAEGGADKAAVVLLEKMRGMVR